ncbi:flagellar protein FlaG [Pelosinus fermentans]|uniref:Flagellar protein FlaG protein n=1 Tax=Pelosinus fermentans JBW45 TaxID=1192197 RepID=I8TW52_9FIRM|nr:flagellar protein FlaG [Pelosinus fermentans]AJQ26076.1 flagellar protein FlaG protein [Pelosinus fermentans JBW45]
MKIDRVSSSGTMQNTDNMPDNVEMDKAKNAAEVNSFQLSKAVDILNKKAEEEKKYDVRFAMYKDTNRVIVQVVDKITNQVISTYPPQQILKMAEMVEQELKIIDKKI